MEYFTFGMKELRVTQNYNGSTSHKLHWYNSTNYVDYPIDIAGKDSGCDIYYAPVDMKVTAIKGIGNSTTNTIWLVATERCNTPSGIMTPFIMLTHSNDRDPYISNLKVGSIVKKGQPICMEGKDGTKANHLHMVCGNADRGCGNGLIKNSNSTKTKDVWVSNGYCMKPEDVMYIDKSFTTIKSTGGIIFKVLPTNTETKESFFGTKGYFSLGNYHENIGKICYFFAENFYGYFYHGEGAKETAHSVLDGNYFGPYLRKWTMEFQKRAKNEGKYDDVIDGCIGPKTLNALKYYGFKE